MTYRTFLIHPRDPVIFRDGKPFTLGLLARSTSWPMPSVVIGAIRTRLGRLTNYDHSTVDKLKLIEHFGPFLATPHGDTHTLAFPAPADAVAFRRGDGQLDVYPARPEKLGQDEGTDLEGILPLLGPKNEKPEELAAFFWSAAETLAWLQKRDCGPDLRANTGISDRPRQRRTHVKMSHATQAAEESRLFTTEALEFSDHERVRDGTLTFRDPRPRICSQIGYAEGESWAALEPLAPIGGERRLAYWSEANVDWPKAPDTLKSERLVRLQLITPGCFDCGWRPKWFEYGKPGIKDLQLKLVAAAVPRPVPLSGWDFTKPGKTGQKATRFLAPAGSVYFCEVIQGDPKDLWMKSISDNEQDRRDGFGLVLCGVWKWR